MGPGIYIFLILTIVIAAVFAFIWFNNLGLPVERQEKFARDYIEKGANETQDAEVIYHMEFKDRTGRLLGETIIPLSMLKYNTEYLVGRLDCNHPETNKEKIQYVFKNRKVFYGLSFPEQETSMSRKQFYLIKRFSASGDVLCLMCGEALEEYNTMRRSKEPLDYGKDYNVTPENKPTRFYVGNLYMISFVRYALPSAQADNFIKSFYKRAFADKTYPENEKNGLKDFFRFRKKKSNHNKDSNIY